MCISFMTANTATQTKFEKHFDQLRSRPCRDSGLSHNSEVHSPSPDSQTLEDILDGSVVLNQTQNLEKFPTELVIIHNYHKLSDSTFVRSAFQ